MKLHADGRAWSVSFFARIKRNGADAMNPRFHVARARWARNKMKARNARTNGAGVRYANWAMTVKCFNSRIRRASFVL